MIRTTTLLDDQNIIALTKEFYPYTSYAKWAPFDDETVVDLIATVRKRGILFVAEEEGKLVGIMGALGVPFIFNRNIIAAHEVIWFVSAEHRKSSLGKTLRKRADQMVALKGWKAFQMVRLEESNPKLDLQFIEDGFFPTEHCFTKVY